MNTETSAERLQAIEKLGELIAKVKFAMLTTADADGTLRSRPMATQDDGEPFNGTLWFYTHDDTAKVDEVRHEHQVNVAYADPGNQLWVSVSGRANVLRDRTKAEQLWTPAMKAWFPAGLDDPKLALLKVEVEKAEYWDTPSSTFVHIVGFVKAIATGKAYHPGENEKITLQS